MTCKEEKLPPCNFSSNENFFCEGETERKKFSLCIFATSLWQICFSKSLFNFLWKRKNERERSAESWACINAKGDSRKTLNAR